MTCFYAGVRLLKPACYISSASPACFEVTGCYFLVWLRKKWVQGTLNQGIKTGLLWKQYRLLIHMRSFDKSDGFQV